MKPILINGDESCYCGKRDWVLVHGETHIIIECYECHFVLDIILNTN